MKEIYAKVLKKAFLLMLFLCLPVFGQDFSKVDQIVSNYPKTFSRPEELASRIKRDFSKEEEKARAIFSWIAFNVKYDVKSFFSRSGSNTVMYRYRTEEEKLQKQNQIKLDKIDKVLQTNAALCQGYSLLYEHLANLSGLESAVVTGNAKTSPNDIGKLPTESSHAWNAVKVNGKWKLLDVTWAAGIVNEQKRIFVPKFNPGYFFTEPDIFILNHFPDEKDWILGNFSEKEYAGFPFYYGDYVKSDFRFISPQNGILSAKKSNVIPFKMENLGQNDTIFYVLSSDNKAKSVVLKRNGNTTEFDVLLTTNSDCFLTIFVNQKAVSMYKIKGGKSTNS